MVTRRGVVFLSDQTVTPQEMKEFCLRLTEAGGRVCCTTNPQAGANTRLTCNSTCLPCLKSSQPESSSLHVHPLTEGSELGDQVSVISSEKQKKSGGLTHQLSDVSRFASTGWHTDISFEQIPSDYAMLKIHTLPPTGGDTVCLAQVHRLCPRTVV